MSIEQNKALARRIPEEFFNKGNPALLDEICAPNFILHGAPGPGTEPVKGMLAMFRTGLPDVKMTIEDIIAEGDKVVFRVTVQGTHQGEFRGIPPTGKQVTITGIQIWRIADDKIAEGWFNRDDLGLMRQLGVIPAPGQA